MTSRRMGQRKFDGISIAAVIRGKGVGVMVSRHHRHMQDYMEFLCMATLTNDCSNFP